VTRVQPTAPHTTGSKGPEEHRQPECQLSNLQGRQMQCGTPASLRAYICGAPAKASGWHSALLACAVLHGSARQQGP
jgi:hypothetical protein